MQENILEVLKVEPQRAAALESRTRTRLLSFLLRWHHLAPLHACLDALLRDKPNLVSLMDLRARAYVSEERYEEAIGVMHHRLDAKSSLSAQVLMTRVYLAAGDVDAAEETAAQLRAEAPGSALPWQLTGEIALAADDIAGALDAYEHARERAKAGRGYLLGMLNAYEAQGDWVTASGYAVRLLETVEHPADLTVGYLRTLRDYFAASREETRVAEMDEAIAQRYEAEYHALRVALGLDVAEPAAQPNPQAESPSGADTGALPAELTVEATDAEEAAIRQAVRDTFGFDDLLPGQLETMACVMRGGNALTVLPTGGGKSLCYQVPALLAEEGITLVVSPLIALMKDQVDSLPDLLRERATTINSNLDGDILQQRLARTQEGVYRLLYAAPERLRQPSFLHALRKTGVNRLVVDEAHCVSVWGHDFRPDYLKIRTAWAALESPPILALTATAPPRVRRDIVQHLSPDKPMAIITGDLTRPNLMLEVFAAANKDEKLQRLLAFCKATTGSGIIYADTRARCERLAALLQQQGVDASYYHAGIPNRDAVQEDFMTGRTRVIVATIAFGMGIDKPDIRFVVHFTPPSSLESYYQEAGRAGRDGKPSRCLLMFSSADQGTLTRRMRRGLPHVEFLRKVYGTLLRHFDGRSVIGVPAGDLTRQLQVDDTQMRVALSILEENGLLERGPDIPRAALLRLTNARRRPQTRPDQFEAFREAGRLQPRQWTRVDLITAAQQIDQDPAAMEDQILQWEAEGMLSHRFSGRDMLLRQTPPPEDIADRISRWLDRFETIQIQRISEITSYARTLRCRHGHLNAYLGGRAVEKCAACDNCITVVPAEDADMPPDHEQMAAILETVAGAPWSWGRYSLTRILLADPKAPDKAQAYPGFGALSYRSRSAIEDFLDRLEHAGFLAPRTLDHGGTVLDLTSAGAAILKTPEKLADIAPQRHVAQSGQTAFVEMRDDKVDESLYEKLRQWRFETAQQKNVPAYVILHNDQLQRIAAQRPQTPDALLTIRGIGPKRMESYGEEILGIIDEHVRE